MTFEVSGGRDGHFTKGGKDRHLGGGFRRVAYTIGEGIGVKTKRGNFVKG